MKNQSKEKYAPQLSKQPPLTSRADRMIVLIGVGYVVTTFSQMSALLDYSYYRYLFQQYSESTIQFRYIISWGVRFLGLAVGIGILSHKEIFRKSALLLAAGTIAVAYWKHPYQGFLQHVNALNTKMHASGNTFLNFDTAIQAFRDMGLTGFILEDFTIICVAAIVVWEIFCALVVIFVLTRPRVKTLFR